MIFHVFSALFQPSTFSLSLSHSLLRMVTSTLREASLPRSLRTSTQLHAYLAHFWKVNWVECSTMKLMVFPPFMFHKREFKRSTPVHAIAPPRMGPATARPFRRDAPTDSPTYSARLTCGPNPNFPSPNVFLRLQIAPPTPTINPNLNPNPICFAPISPQNGDPSSFNFFFLSRSER